jgi:hypothetical protein
MSIAASLSVKHRLDSEFVNLMNQNHKIVTKDFAKGLVDHGSIGLGTKAVTKFSFHHREGRFEVRPLVVAGQVLFVLPYKEVEHKD